MITFAVDVLKSYSHLGRIFDKSPSTPFLKCNGPRTRVAFHRQKISSSHTSQKDRFVFGILNTPFTAGSPAAVAVLFVVIRGQF